MIPITPQTPLISPIQSNANAVLSWARAQGALRLAFLADYLVTLYQLGAETGLNADLAAFQSMHECGDEQGRPWTSLLWQQRGNPAGLGVTGGPDDPHLSFATGQAAARAQVAHLLLYATGTSIHGSVNALLDDPRAPAYLAAYGSRAIAPTLAALAGTWALDPAYAAGIVSFATRFFADQPGVPPMSVTFGNVPMPTIQLRYVTDAQSGAWDDLGPRTVQGVVWHRMEGTLWGTDGWFRRGKGVSDGLTELGIGNLTTDGAQNDGVILGWNDPTGAAHPGVSPNRAPWASGPVDAPYGDGLAFLQDHHMDVNIVNRDQVAIEIAGDYLDPVSDKARESLCQLTAYYADQAKIPFDSFPIIPGKGYSFVRWHREFTIGSGKPCPGQVVMDLTDGLIARIKVILQHYQSAPSAPPVVPSPPLYSKPGQIPVADGSEKTIHGSLFYPIVRLVTVTAAQAACRAYADPHAGLTRAPLTKGETFLSQWVIPGSDQKLWWVTKSGTRIAMADTNGQFPK